MHWHGNYQAKKKNNLTEFSVCGTGFFLPNFKIVINYEIYRKKQFPRVPWRVISI